MTGKAGRRVNLIAAWSNLSLLRGLAIRHRKAHSARMARVATKTRTRRVVTAKQTAQAEPPARSLGKYVEARFRDGVAQAVEQAHAANVPIAVLTDDNEVAWLHPDGIVRRTRTPIRRAAGS